MPFQVSPGVNVSEIDLTTVVPAVSTTEGAIAGVFRWGPVESRTLVDSETNLAARFGKPTNHNAETFFTAANFLSYGNKLYVARAANTTANSAANTGGTLHVVRNAIANTSTITEPNDFIVKHTDDYNTKDTAGTFATDTDAKYIAKYPGDLGNSLKVSVCDSATAYKFVANVDSGGGNLSSNTSTITVALGSSNIVFNVAVGNGSIGNATSYAGTLVSALTVGDYIEVGNSSIGKQFMKVASLSAITNTSTVATFTVTTEDVYSLATAYSSNTSAYHANGQPITGVVNGVNRYWEFFNSVDVAPGTSAYQTNFGNSSIADELHVVVTDEDGKFSGTPGAVLEVFRGLSRATDAKTEDGSTNFYKDVINQSSNYIWWANARANATSNTAINLTASTNLTPLSLSFAGGTDGLDENNAALSSILTAYDLFASAESVDVSLILAGSTRGGTNGEQLANYLIDNIAEKRKDCVVFVSPQRADVVNALGNEATNIVALRNSLRSTSYAVMDSGYKYQYDKYNDLYRYVPLNGDTAGLCVRTDDVRDPWFSPAGFNRGQVKNIVKLAYNPSKADRDVLYKSGVNPVVTFPGQGTVLFGDKTLLSKPSAFDRINVRRLFIVLEKAIATATQFTLFEFNDDFTRAQFRNLVEPFLRDVQGRRGIYDFKVVCDSTNNTGEVIDRNEFIGDIYIKPAKSINFIQLNFVAVRTGVEFSEVVGQF